MRTEVYEDKKGEFRWRKRAANGRIVSSSSEGYKTRWGAKLAASKFAGLKKNDEIDWLWAALVFIIAALLGFLVGWLIWGAQTAADDNQHQSPAPMNKPEPKPSPVPQPATPAPEPQPDQPEPYGK